MTRDQFDATFAATLSNTEGFTQPQITALNDLIYAQVGGLNPDDRWTRDSVQHAFETYACDHRVVQA